MYNRKLFAWIVVLMLASAACRAATSAAELAQPSASATPQPAAAVPDSTATPLEPTATQLPPPTASPTPDRGSAPVIESVEVHEDSSTGEMIIYQDIQFLDADGDAYFVDFELVSSTAQGLVTRDSSIKTAASEQQRGATLTADWTCGSDSSYQAKLRVIIADKKGNKSEPFDYDITCSPVEVVASFPDPFEDNRNQWGLTSRYSIHDGQMQFRDDPASSAYWIWCDLCLVSPVQNSASVEISWSNTADGAAGLLIDHQTCTPDGLVFVFGPHGYYSILQAVRDAEGKWSHWRRFIEWTQSSKIRRAKDQANLVTAEYEFGSSDLHVKLFLNRSYITRVRVFGYNGAGECRPGLFSDSSLDANFDNFSIPAVK